jgi:hypothetical protein
VSKVTVHVVPHGRGYRLELYHEGVHIGEYEQSWASEEDREAKVREAERASDLLLDTHRRHGGKIAVRWNGKTRPRQKEIRTYQEDQPYDPGQGGTVLAMIPRRIWRKP